MPDQSTTCTTPATADEPRRAGTEVQPEDVLAKLQAALRKAGGTSQEITLLDARADDPVRWASGDRVVIVAESPAPMDRLNWLSRGALDVVDTTRPLRESTRSLHNLVDRLATGREDPILDDLRTRSPAMRRLLRDSKRFADADASVLITGETGVGKEFLARTIHQSSPRKDAPFVVVNCGALPESLLESQLFGHEKGAFTGADRTHLGYFEAANGGTLLLDEIGEMPLHLQVKLLTVLERREVMRLGSQKPVEIDVRVMAATNRDIMNEVDGGRFRSDLLYRLNVIHLVLPPLARRVEDVPELTGRFVRELRGDADTEFEGVEPTALEAMMAWTWPGNVRELRNVVERALLMSRGTCVAFDELPDELRGGGDAATASASQPAIEFIGKTLREVREAAVAATERAFLVHLLEQTRGRVGETAKLAGLKPRSLYDKMKLYELRKEDYRKPR